MHRYGRRGYGARDVKGQRGDDSPALLAERARHGYELARLIESQSQSRMQFHAASLYPMLYRLERKRLVAHSVV